MRKRGVLAIPIVMMATLLTGWIGAQDAPKRFPTTTPQGWKVSLTPDGVPDLEGVWTNATLTPLQRAANAKEFFTEAEARAFERETIARDLTSSVAQSYDAFWFDRGNQVVPTLRTSLIIDPPDGRVPALSDFGRQVQQERAASRRGRGQADGPESRSLAERCIVWPTGGPPMMPSFYNNNYQIVQGPGFVAIHVEMIHDVRIIPTDGRAHIPDSIRTWMGDPVGHWDGDTLVVETTNFNGEAPFNGSSREMRLIEKFRRVNDGMLMYEFTVNDPAFTRPWTAQIPMTVLNEPIYEYACNEGNYAMTGMLAGAREAEKAGGR